MKFFVAVFEEGSFSEAARRENATQSGVSMQIRNLERRLGVRLFERGSNGVTPTHAGRRYYARCVPILNAVRAAEEEISALSGDVSGQLRVGLIPALTRGAAPKVVIDYMQRFPNVDLQIVEGYSQALTDLVLGGELDFAIVPQLGPQTGLEARLLARDYEMLVTGPRAKMVPNKPVRLAELPPLRLVLPAIQNSRRATLEQYFNVEGVAIERIMQFDGMIGTFQMILETDWATILPMTMMIHEIGGDGHGSPQLCINPIVDPTIYYSFMLIQPSRQPLSQPAQLFVDMLENALNEALGYCEEVFAPTRAAQ
jgi:DNA-binding transcriptional LysR family regulator